MQIEVKEQKDNTILQRKEVIGELKFEGATPSNQALQRELAKKLGSNEELVMIKHIYGVFGGGSATFEAVAYPSQEQLEKIEPSKLIKTLKEKKAKAEEASKKAAEEKKAAEKKEEAPAEKKEEAKAAPAEEKKKEAAEEKKEAE